MNQTELMRETLTPIGMSELLPLIKDKMEVGLQNLADSIAFIAMETSFSDFPPSIGQADFRTFCTNTAIQFELVHHDTDWTEVEWTDTISKFIIEKKNYLLWISSDKFRRVS